MDDVVSPVSRSVKNFKIASHFNYIAPTRIRNLSKIDVIKGEQNPMERQKRTASIPELADILGVERSTVTKAISTKRLEQSIVPRSSPKRLEIFAACIEWYTKKQVSKDRYVKDKMDIQDSKARHEYYRSLLTKLEYDVKSGHLLPLEEVRQKGMEICRNARRYLDDRRDSDALHLPTFKDDFESRKLLRERDDAFMERLVELETVGDQVAQESAERFADELQHDGEQEDAK